MNASQFLKEITAVEGYIELGLLEEAANRLEELPSDLKATAEVVDLHIRILVEEGQFLKASFLTETLSMSDPVSLKKALNVARYRLAANVPGDALDWLKKSEIRWSKSGDYHYLLAQCYSVLGDLGEMKVHLTTALKLNSNLLHQALDDPCFDSLFGQFM